MAGEAGEEQQRGTAKWGAARHRLAHIMQRHKKFS